jgi:hypothetical protein
MIIMKKKLTVFLFLFLVFGMLVNFSFILADSLITPGDTINLGNYNNGPSSQVQSSPVIRSTQSPAPVISDTQSNQTVRLFGLFTVNMTVNTTLNARTGKVITVEKPWWAFLTMKSP